jgi:tetratricopeptide (TPR) repeat protein
MLFFREKGCKQMNRKQRRAAKRLSETSGPARRQFVEEGLRHHQAGRLDQAKKLYLGELTLDPTNADAMHFLGLVHRQQGDLPKAEGLISKALAIKPGMAEAHSNLGVVLIELRRFEEALFSCDRALALQPSYAEALSNRGLALYELKRLDEALASYDRALALRPDYAEALINRGNALCELKRFDEAVAIYDRALALRPDLAETLSNRGNALCELKRFDEAVASYDRALALRPDYAEALLNRGAVLQELERDTEAVASYDRALALRPDFAEALSNRGTALYELKRLDEALASYDRALALRSDYAEAHHNEAHCRLLIGDFNRGWEKYEWRWKTRKATEQKRNFAQPLWLGTDDIAGKTILLHAEQGFGDTIQFCRYVPRVVDRAARVIVEVERPLHELISTLPGGARIVSRGDPLPDFDIHCPLLSLPLAFRTRLETIPSEIPYLFAAEKKTNAWRERLGQHEMPRVGLVWSGSSRKEQRDANRIDRQRSIAFDQLAPLLEITECEFYSLQKGDDPVAQLHNSPLHQRVIDWTADLHDFSDTAALIENLDLVITVDTSVAHLAGALRKPFWLINRFNTCWRWLLDREDSPWYSTARIFRQPSWGDWTSVIHKIAFELRRSRFVN